MRIKIPNNANEKFISIIRQPLALLVNTMKAKELRQKTDKELELMLKESREKIRSLRFDLVSKKLKKTNELSEARRQVARILTVLRK